MKTATGFSGGLSIVGFSSEGTAAMKWIGTPR